MQRSSTELGKIKDKLVEHSWVSFNPFTYELRRKCGYLVPIDFYFEDLIDVTSFENLMIEINNNIAFFREEYIADYNFEEAFYVDISAPDSFYQVTVDLWFEEFSDAINIAEQLDIPSQDIYDISEQCYIYDNEEE